MGPGEGGEGGESGEGGVDFASASTDPVEYGSALAVAEAHAIAARDAFAIGRTDEAAEMFAHPVSEVLLNMDPVFSELGVDDFKPLFSDASAAVLNGESEAQINERFNAIVSALRAAAGKAPDDGTSDAMVEAGVVADQIDRAISMYRQAASDGIYPPYLDGYGFYKAAEVIFAASDSEIKQADADLHARLTAALALLAKAYPGAEMPPKLDADQSALTASGSAFLLALPAR
ncbi:hypothetical protein CD351_06380 [Erythrobacter sp. KY5]|nr:hypothetical protein CD351_06380 [Erythrobacter sp. KY5]